MSSKSPASVTASATIASSAGASATTSVSSNVNAHTDASTTSSDADVELVRPLLPTILGDLPSLPIPGTDLIFASIEGGFVFPGTVSRPRLTAALARTLQLHPHAAGRLLRNPTTSTWYLALLNAPVSLSFDVAPPTFDSTDPNRYEERDPVFVDLVPFGFAPLSSETEPVVRLKVVSYPLTGESSLFLSWCHALGDGTTAYAFLHTLYAFYHALTPLYIPTYEKYLSTPPPRLERHLVQETLREVPHLAVDYGKEEFYGMYAGMVGGSERVDLQFGEGEVDAIWRGAGGGGGGSEISRRDALSAYLITVLNRAMPETPIVRVMNVVDFRGAPVSTENPTYRPPTRTAAGNLTLTHFIDIPGASSSSTSTLSLSSSPSSSSVTTHTSSPSLPLLAHTIHTSVTTPRTSGEHVRRVVCLSEELYARSTASGRLQWWFPYVPGLCGDGSGATSNDEKDAKGRIGVTVAINNLSNADFPAIHFSEGVEAKASDAPIRSRFYTFDSWAHYMRIWRGNPLPVYASSSSSSSTFPSSRPHRDIVAWTPEQRALRVFFRVKKGRREVAREIVRRDMEGLRSGKGLRLEGVGREKAKL